MFGCIGAFELIICCMVIFSVMNILLLVLLAMVIIMPASANDVFGSFVHESGEIFVYEYQFTIRGGLECTNQTIAEVRGYIPNANPPGVLVPDIGDAGKIPIKLTFDAESSECETSVERVLFKTGFDPRGIDSDYVGVIENLSNAGGLCDENRNGLHPSISNYRCYDIEASADESNSKRYVTLTLDAVVPNTHDLPDKGDLILLTVASPGTIGVGPPNTVPFNGKLEIEMIDSDSVPDTTIVIPRSEVITADPQLPEGIAKAPSPDTTIVIPRSEVITADPQLPEGIAKTPSSDTSDKKDDGGGCLIATAAYDTELAPQVQFLREIRDNTVMNTDSGMAFMTGFNQLYYSFSPTIADLERENPVFQEAVRMFITPMISTLSIMTLADDGSELQVLVLGISVIALNLGMYVAAPVLIGFKIRKHLKSRI